MLELQQRLPHREHRIPITFISAHGDSPMAVRPMKEGAVEFPPKLNKQIAAQLGLSENTIKVHRHRIMEKMGAGQRRKTDTHDGAVGLKRDPDPRRPTSIRRIVPVPAQEHTRHRDDPDKCMASRQRRDVVAVVEDDAGVRSAIEALLHSRSLKTRCFPSAEEFLKATRTRPACLVLDLRLPGMTGLELLRTLQEQGKSIPTICISGEVDGDRRARAQLLRAGAVAVLAKPFDPEELLCLVERALGKRPDA